MIKAGIIGATGYAGNEIVRLLLGHKDVEIKWFGSRSYIDQQYADIYVNLEIGMTDDNGVTLEDALKTLSTDILAGNGPDVLILDGMPVDSYVEKGILTDISDVVDEVKASDGLVDSIVKDSTKDGKIYAIPTRFLVSFITSDQQTVDAGKSTQALADRIVPPAA